jgi:aspartate aminotransferase
MADMDLLKKLGQWVVEKKMWIVSDEIYEYMDFQKPHVSILNACPNLFDQVILVNGLSKGFAMTGWRVGYCAAPKSFAALVRAMQSQTSTCLPSFIEDAAVQALSLGKEAMREDLSTLSKNRDKVVAFLSKIKDLDWVSPDGAFYLFIDMRTWLLKCPLYADSLSTERFCMDLLNQAFVALVPGDAFGCPGFVRLSYAPAWEELQEGLNCFKEFLEKKNECS